MNIVTYNVWGLPFCPSRNRCRAVANHVSDLMTQCDVMILQEVWAAPMKTHLRAVFDAMNWSVIEPPAASGILRLDSGVWLASKLAMGTPTQIVFRSRTGMDAFADKGATGVDVRSNNGFVARIVGFHLQNGKGQTPVRQAQAQQMVDTYGLEAIYVGDTNEPSNALEDILGRISRPVADTHVSDGCIDYGFSHTSMSSRVLVPPSEGLSDHYPVQLTIGQPYVYSL